MVPQSNNVNNDQCLRAESTCAARRVVENLNTTPVATTHTVATTVTRNLLHNKTVTAQARRRHPRGTLLGLSVCRMRKTQGGPEMTVILILLMVTIFMTLDYAFGRKSVEQPVTADAPEPMPLPQV